MGLRRDRWHAGTGSSRCGALRLEDSAPRSREIRSLKFRVLGLGLRFREKAAFKTCICKLRS